MVRFTALAISTLSIGISDAAQTSCASDEVQFAEGCVSRTSAYQSAYDFLYSNLPSWDKTNKQSLGFHDSVTPDTDGLDDGIATLGLNISLDAQQKFSWAWDLPQDIYQEYVATYAHVNEARVDWRPIITTATSTILDNAPSTTDLSTVEDVVSYINSQIPPLIYDPMSTLVYGYASCTGVSILFADALKSVGIAARVSGTPAWNGAYENGNHNWIEVYLPETGEWAFMEAAPAGGGETLSNPCDKWFCSPTKMANGTQFFSSRFDSNSGVAYPMAWDLENLEVPGDDRTAYYQDACNKC
ncbi:hypothetical protein TL16_g11024 [Triparma laevis f. inornata]|uniref:Transglutaminase-like domain-containing protein n=1 Tax=Triparma laevis f. inornata TaxID=1714386 RepID=A0A9W7BCB1_9STRA|nr:hypothetical protein TL16_g11024 [Triparma laevis f. inornata]